MDLSSHTEGVLFRLIEAMAEAIRQFSTFEQRLSRDLSDRESYFAALEMLRGHLHRVLLQVSFVANVKIPKISDHMRYDDVWQLEAYQRPSLPALGAQGDR